MRDPEEMLAVVKAEGLRRRRRRHVRWQVGSGLLVLALALPLALAVVDEDRSAEVAVAGRGDDGNDRSSSRRATTTTVTTPTTTAAVVATDTTAVVEATTTTVAALDCRNSADPACGPFYWDPAPPADEPLQVSIVPSNPNPLPGEEVVFTISWSDADATLTQWNFFSHDEPQLLPNGCDSTYTREDERYGPWDPPAPNPGSGSFEERRTYISPGTYTVGINALAQSGGGACPDPYESYASATVTITVG